MVVESSFVVEPDIARYRRFLFIFALVGFVTGNLMVRSVLLLIEVGSLDLGSLMWTALWSICGVILGVVLVGDRGSKRQREALRITATADAISGPFPVVFGMRRVTIQRNEFGVEHIWRQGWWDRLNGYRRIVTESGRWILVSDHAYEGSDIEKIKAWLAAPKAVVAPAAA